MLCFKSSYLITHLININSHQQIFNSSRSSG
jgi:hypothetical protein